MSSSLSSIFSKVPDFRVQNRCLHRLEDILFIAFCTLLSNGEDFEDMVEFGHQRLDWLQTILELPNGIPSHDTFNRVLQIVDPELLSDCLSKHSFGLLESVRGKLIHLDGKKMRGVSPKSKGNKGLHILSAWVGEDRLCIGQQKVQDKSNEITAIPELIEHLDLEGSVVSIDAIGCQTAIAKKIKDSKADYLLAVKQNQGHLFNEISDSYLWKTSCSKNHTWEYDHGRFEQRTCQIIKASECLTPYTIQKWEGIQTIVKIDSQRIIEGVESCRSRYYISSEKQEASYYNTAIRDHWGIENHLHWHLDVTFNEDSNRTRTGFAPQNLNILRKMALQKIARIDDKLSLKKRRFKASMNTQYLTKVINI